MAGVLRGEATANRRRIAVVMSTYNGGPFLCEQIDTILEQKGVDVDLYIRDDGSSDSTPIVIADYGRKYPNVLPLSDEVGGVGPGVSFLLLLCAVVDGAQNRYDFYAFADQDDVWLPGKLKEAVECIDGIEEPCLYCSNQYIYQNRDRFDLALRYEVIPDCSLAGHMNTNGLSGCTMVMNSSLARLVANSPFPPKEVLDYRMHDAWVFLVAASLGKVCYDERSFILYRIHERNTVGIRKPSSIERARRVILPASEKSPYANIRLRTAQALLERYPELESVDCISQFAHYQRSWKDKLRLLRVARDNCRYTDETPLEFALKVLVNFV